jgi:hypothetical protein
VALATQVAVGEQDRAEFRRLLETALAVPVDAVPERRLANALARRKASFLLDHEEDLFLEPLE